MYNLYSLRKIGIISTQGVSDMTLTEYVKDVVDDNMDRPSFEKLTDAEQDKLIALKIQSYYHDVDIVLSQETNKALVNYLFNKSISLTELLAYMRADLIEQFGSDIDDALTDRKIELMAAGLRNPWNDTSERYFVGGI